jgi:hypothetical protein
MGKMKSLSPLKDICNRMPNLKHMVDLGEVAILHGVVVIVNVTTLILKSSVMISLGWN